MTIVYLEAEAIRITFTLHKTPSVEETPHKKFWGQVRPVRRGGFGGFGRTPLSAAVIHMNLYGTYL